MTDREFRKALKALVDHMDVENLTNKHLANVLEAMLTLIKQLTKEAKKRIELHERAG